MVCSWCVWSPSTGKTSGNVRGNAGSSREQVHSMQITARLSGPYCSGGSAHIVLQRLDHALRSPRSELGATRARRATSLARCDLQTEPRTEAQGVRKSVPPRLPVNVVRSGQRTKGRESASPRLSDPPEWVHPPSSWALRPACCAGVGRRGSLAFGRPTNDQTAYGGSDHIQIGALFMAYLEQARDGGFSASAAP